MSKKEDNSSFWLLGGLAVLGIGAAVLLGGNSSTQQDNTSYGGGGSAGGMGDDVVTDMPGVSGDVQYPPQGQQQPIVQYIPQYIPQYVPQPQQVPNYKAMEAYEAGLQLADSLNTDANNFAEQGIIPTDVHYSYAENLGGGVAYATGTLTEEAQRNVVESINNPTPAPVKPQGTISFASGESYFAFVNPNDISQVYIAKKQTTSDAPSRTSSSGGWSSGSSSSGSSSSSSSSSGSMSFSGGGGGKLSGVSSSGSLSGGGSFVDI